MGNLTKKDILIGLLGICLIFVLFGGKDIKQIIVGKRVDATYQSPQVDQPQFQSSTGNNSPNAGRDVIYQAPKTEAEVAREQAKEQETQRQKQIDNQVKFAKEHIQQARSIALTSRANIQDAQDLVTSVRTDLTSDPKHQVPLRQDYELVLALANASEVYTEILRKKKKYYSPTELDTNFDRQIRYMSGQTKRFYSMAKTLK